eukprot:GHVU01064364.1.p1 GENE.GHVU01064364.1~~GHVU01064364.1.p1  ORF type:complete len:496 (+),score=79.90 GHVU01064364.1:133-1620(+)
MPVERPPEPIPPETFALAARRATHLLDQVQTPPGDIFHSYEDTLRVAAGAHDDHEALQQLNTQVVRMMTTALANPYANLMAAYQAYRQGIYAHVAEICEVADRDFAPMVMALYDGDDDQFNIIRDDMSASIRTGVGRLPKLAELQTAYNTAVNAVVEIVAKQVSFRQNIEPSPQVVQLQTELATLQTELDKAAIEKDNFKAMATASEDLASQKQTVNGIITKAREEVKSYANLITEAANAEKNVKTSRTIWFWKSSSSSVVDNTSKIARLEKQKEQSEGEIRKYEQIQKDLNNNDANAFNSYQQQIADRETLIQGKRSIYNAKNADLEKLRKDMATAVQENLTTHLRDRTAFASRIDADRVASMLTLLMIFSHKLDDLNATITGGRNVFLDMSARKQKRKPAYLFSSLRFFLKMQIKAPMLVSGTVPALISTNEFQTTHARAVTVMSRTCQAVKDDPSAKAELEAVNERVTNPSNYQVPMPPQEDIAAMPGGGQM